MACPSCGGLGQDLEAGKLVRCGDCDGTGQVPAVEHYALGVLAGSPVPCEALPSCGHEHQPSLGGICIGCPCPWRPPAARPELLPIPKEHRPGGTGGTNA